MPPPAPEPAKPAAERFAGPPDPGPAGTLDDLVERLRLLKVWAGDPSYERITDRINSAWRAAGRPAAELTRKNTVADCFKIGRRRLNTDLLMAVVYALHPEAGYVTQWQQALRVIGGEIRAASQVRVQASLPQDLATFTGRTAELDQLSQALQHTQHHGAAVVISAIEGMAGVGKTQLAIHAGHMLVRQKAFDRVLFVNLRGFHPDPAQPPADPAAVLDGFLRLLGVPGQQVPHDLGARAAAYRDLLAGTQTLVVLDNAADAEQVRPLLPATPGCLTLVTSRRDLTGLQPAVHLTVDVFAAQEALDFLAGAVPEVPVGSDPLAASRIAHRCGYLPLALGLVAGHIRNTSGWTLTDHADRLDERHHRRQLETGVELALHLSYQHLTADQRRLLRLAALHPGQDLDAYAVAALTDTDLPAAQAHLHDLCRDHLLQQAGPGRYTFHDLVRAYAAARAGDEDPPSQRHAALTRLFGHYLATAATAMDVAYPHERQRRPAVPPASTPAPDLSDEKRADRWLDTELANLLAVAEHGAEHGWPEQTWQLSATLDRHLRTRGRHHDAETLHTHALRIARRLDNPAAEMNALNGLGYIDRILGRHAEAGEHYRRALWIAQDIGDRGGELYAQHGLGDVHWTSGDYAQAGKHYVQALRIAREIGDRAGELHALQGHGYVHRALGHHERAGGDYEQALRIAQDIGDRGGELYALQGLGYVHRTLGRLAKAGDLYGRALRIAQDIGDRGGELYALQGLGSVYRTLGRHAQAGEHYGQAFQIAKDIGDNGGEVNALLGLGSVHQTLGRYEQAGDHFGQALQVAQATGDRGGELYALRGLGSVHRMLCSYGQAADRYQQVLDLAGQLGDRNGEFEALQGLGRLHHETGHPDLALTHHQQALQHATELAQLADQARAHDGLAHAHRALHHQDQARQHWQCALDILTRLRTDHTDDIEANLPAIRAHLTSLHQQEPPAASE